MVDRRQFTRRPVYVPVSISTDDRKGRAGITRDVSAGGVLFHSTSRFAIGERVDIEFGITKARVTTATGHVVRVFRDPDQNLFGNITAIAFAFPLPEIEAALA